MGNDYAALERIPALKLTLTDWLAGRNAAGLFVGNIAVGYILR